MKVASDVMTMPGTWLDTPSRTVIRINWSPVGFGATTHGWRPISVNTHPEMLARNGVGMVSSANQETQRLLGVRPPRVSHSTVRANNTGIASNPIIKRKDQ